MFSGNEKYSSFGHFTPWFATYIRKGVQETRVAYIAEWVQIPNYYL